MVKIYQLTLNHTYFIDVDRRRYYHEGVADLYHGKQKSGWCVYYGMPVDRDLEREKAHCRCVVYREDASTAALVDGTIVICSAIINQAMSINVFNRIMETGDARETIQFRYWYGILESIPHTSEICMKGQLRIVEDFHDVADRIFDENEGSRRLIKAHYLREHHLYTELSDNLGGLFRSGSQADVVFRCRGNDIPAHKLILSTRSPVFEAMFKSGMHERQNGVVDIVDMAPDTLKAMLMHIYTLKPITLTYRKAVKIIYAAEKYQLDILKEMCRDHLKSCLSKNNALSLLVLGDLLDQQLKISAMDFICNHVCDLQKRKNWNHVQSKHPALAAEIMELYSKVEKSPEKDSVSSKFDLPAFILFNAVSYFLIWLSI